MEEQNNSLQSAMSDEKPDAQQNDNTLKTSKIIKSKIGGQALIEGIMMRGLDKSSMAVRCPDGSIDLEVWSYDSSKNSKWFRKSPLVRGSINMVESLIIGYKCLMKSADKAMEEIPEDKQEKGNSEPDSSDQKDAEQAALDMASKELETEDRQESENTNIRTEDAAEIAPKDNKVEDKQDTPKEQGKTVQSSSDKNQNDKEQGGFTGLLTIVGMVLGLGLALLLFMFLPMLVVNLISNFVTLGFWKTAVEGVIKIAVLILYMAAMSLLKDTRRTFEYHGAEHKSIACYEAGEALTVENVKKFKRFHPRCGTSFILIVLIISIIVTSVVTWNTLWLRLIIKLALLPVIVGISYEIIRLAGRYDNPVTRAVSAPGLALQRLTTKEPDDSQIEVAIKALNAVIPKDREADQW